MAVSNVVCAKLFAMMVGFHDGLGFGADYTATRVSVHLKVLGFKFYLQTEPCGIKKHRAYVVGLVCAHDVC